MSTHQGYTGVSASLRSTSIMANARYNFAITPKTDAYVGLGLGSISVQYDGATQFPTFTGSQSTMGGQVELGLRIKTSERASVFAAVKQQNAFKDVTIVGTKVSYSSSNVIIGIGFSF